MYYRLRMTNCVKLLNLRLIKSISCEDDKLLIEYPYVSYGSSMYIRSEPAKEYFKFESSAAAQKVLDEIHDLTQEMH